VSSAADPQAWTAQVLASQPSVSIGACLSRAGGLLAGNLGLLFGASFLVWSISIVLDYTTCGVLTFVLRGALYGGFYGLILSRIRGQPAGLGAVFAGFREGFGQLMLAGMVATLLTKVGMCCLLLPGLYLYVAWLFAIPLIADRQLEFWSAMEASRKVVNRVWFQVFAVVLLAFLPSILVHFYLQWQMTTAIMPTMQELINTALASGHPDMERFGTTVRQVEASIRPLVLLAKGVLLLNLPFATAALMYAYEDLFGSRRTPQA
jgi:hypothetical protein